MNSLFLIAFLLAKPIIPPKQVISFLPPREERTGNLRGGEKNLLLNGDFRRVFQRAPAEWGGHEGISYNRRDAGHPHCLLTAIDFPQDAFASQYIPLDGRRITQLQFGVSAAWENVRRGHDHTNTCRASLNFFDAHGGSLGEGADLGQWTGTRDWQRYARLVAVPPDARRVQITLGLNGCSGRAWFTDARLETTRGDLTYRTPPDSRTDTRDWLQWEAPIEKTRSSSNVPPLSTSPLPASSFHEPPGSAGGNPFNPSAVNALDVSFLLDAPAGKHGYTGTRPDGHLYFADGTRARFWGVDIMADACFPNHLTAQHMCDRLARNGINIVRLHHIDAPWSKPGIIDPHFNDTQHLNAPALDRLDYFVAQLRKAGIYVYLDLLTNRHFKAGDKVRSGVQIEDGLKIVAHFDPRIKQLHKQYIRQLLTHVNPYTKLRWLDDPALALMEVINEDSLLYEDWYHLVPPAYKRDLRLLCRARDARADPQHEPFDAPTRRALYLIETDYYAEMRGYLRALGVRCATTGSNHWEDLGVALRADADTDYIDRHFYWDHPEGGFGYFQKFDNTPMLTNPIDNGLLPMLAQMRVADKPFVVTEWCFCWPNDYIAEGPMIGTLAACQQDWDAMIWFDFSGNIENGGQDWSDVIDNEFDLSNKPHVFGQWAAAALAFHRRDIAPHAAALTASASDADLFAGRLLGDGFALDAAFTHRLQTRLGVAHSQKARSDSASQGFLWQTPESRWNALSGVLTINTPCTVALVGFSGGMTVTFDTITLMPTTEFSALIVSSLDGMPLATSRHLLLTATARAENTGMVMTPGRTSVTNPGRTPIRVETVHGMMQLKRSTSAEGPAWKAYALDAHGDRREPIALMETAGATIFKIGAAPTLWVEFIR